MSAWSGSAWEEEKRIDEEARQADIDRILRENPWLSREDCERWQQQQAEASKPPLKCCPCAGRPPGIVRQSVRADYDHAAEVQLGPCKCGCHEARKR